MSKIGLVDVDSHNFPNIALMKIAAWHTQRGDSVEFAIPICKYDKIYVSKIFTFTPDIEFIPQAEEVEYGGTGYSLNSKLPPEIERVCPLYSLYPQFDESYGFLTRGCPRACKFCIISEKEGRVSKQVADLSDFWRGQKIIKLLDANLLACTDREKLLSQLISSKKFINFTQGLDIRLMTKDIAKMLMRCKIKMLNFAWDSEQDSTVIVRNLEQFKRYTNINERKTQVYVLTNYNTEFSFDLERIYTLKRLGYLPYIMIYDKQNAPRNVRLLQRWVNNRKIFRSCDRFEDYNPQIG